MQIVHNLKALSYTFFFKFPKKGKKTCLKDKFFNLSYVYLPK